MLVSVDGWRTVECRGRQVEFAAVQMEHFGFTLSRGQAEEFCRKLDQLRAGEECATWEDDTLFVDLDGTNRESAFVILALTVEDSYVRWFCDIPLPAATELHQKLTKALRSSDSEVECAES